MICNIYVLHFFKAQFLVLSGLRCAFEFSGEIIYDLLQSEAEMINIGLPAARALIFCLT